MQDTDTIVSEVMDQLKKAAVINSTYTFTPSVRSIYSPENLDQVIKTLVPVTAPVRGILPRKAGLGQAAGWFKLTSRLDPQAGGTGTRLGFADAGQPTQTTQTYVFASAAYKNLGRDVEIGRQAIASNQGDVENLRAQQEKVKMIEVLLGEEDITLNGDSATQTNEYDGFAKCFTTNSGTASLLTASGISVYAQSLFLAGAEAPTHLVASARQMRALADDLQGSGSIQRIVVDNQGAAVGGAHVSKIVNSVTGSLIDLVTSRYSGLYAYLLTVTSPAGDNWLEMEDLEPMSIYDVPDSNHAIQSRVYETTVFKCIGEVYQYKISGLVTT